MKSSNYKYGMFHVGRTEMWGNYCPETREYYLACEGGVLASGCYLRDEEWQVQQERGYSYAVVRELLQLGHLTSKTLETFLKEGGSVWWFYIVPRTRGRKLCEICIHTGGLCFT